MLQPMDQLLTVVGPEPNAHHITFFVKIDRLDFLHARFEVGFGIKHRFGGDVADFDVIRQHPPVNGFRCMCHKAAAFEAGFLEEPREGAAVIKMKTIGKFKFITKFKAQSNELTAK